MGRVWEASRQARKQAGRQVSKQASNQASKEGKQAGRQGGRQSLGRHSGRQALGRHSVGAVPWRGLFLKDLKRSLSLFKGRGSSYEDVDLFDPLMFICSFFHE